MLTETITQSVRCNDKKHPKGCLSVFVNSVSGVFTFEAIGPQFIKGSFYVLDFNETALLNWITTILRETYLYTIFA